MSLIQLTQRMATFWSMTDDLHHHYRIVPTVKSCRRSNSASEEMPLYAHVRLGHGVVVQSGASNHAALLAT